MEWHAFVISVILLLVVSDSNAKSIDQVCSRTCESGGIRKFFPRNDYEYVYNYETVVKSNFHSDATEEETANLKIAADFSIITSSDCNLVLQINRGIRFDNRRPGTQDEFDWQRAVTAHPLYFQWENGVVKQVCPAENEPVWVVNFKRGILSALQSAADETSSGVMETDVSGKCESDYFVEEQSYQKRIRKIKDFTTCENRNEHLLFSWSMPYEIDSLRQNYIQSSQGCEQTVRDVLTSVRCNEEHTFRPFSSEEAAAKTSITQTITFTSQRYLRSYEAEEFPMRKTSLAFENEAKTSTQSMQETTTEAKAILTEICTNMNGEEYDTVSKQFMSLVAAVRELDADSLVELRDHVRTCTEHRTALSQMLSNTLPFCGTEGCLTFASTLIVGGELEDDVAKRWLLGFGMIKQPSIGMIRSVLDIVENNIHPEQSFLSVGSMIQQYCANSENNCMDNSNIRNAVEVIMQHLGSNCHSVSVEDRERTILALRAIGNAGQTTSVPTLKRCFSENLNSMEVRIAATEAFRRMPCGTDRSGLLQILEDTSQDAELRISAYRNLMQCPTDRVLVSIKSLLSREENMQVGSFIWSHLMEVKESQDPLKIFFSKLLESYTFKEFDLDARKYSRYYEATAFSEKFNSGGSVDASVVWSPKSFIPRSATSSLAVHVFGQAFNLFEVGGRLEGAEDYLQSILEPLNYQKREESKNLIDSESRHRQRTREAPSKKAHLSAYMRVFGKELAYYNTEMIARQAESGDSTFWSNVVSKFMSTDGYNYHDDTLLLESAHTLPTGIGMPLYMKFKGSSSVDIQAKGSLQLGMATTSYGINGKFTPRAAITVSGSLIVDSHVRQTGIATESVGYTSTSLSGSVTLLNGGQNFNIELESPFERNMALKFDHKLLKVNGAYTERLSAGQVANTKVCSEEYLGQRLCYTNTFSDDERSGSGYVLPRSGEIEISAYSEKTDPSITKYTVSGTRTAFYESEENFIPSSVYYQLDFDTPGSTTNRRSMVMASYNIPEKQVAMIIQKGDEVSRLQGFYITNENSKVLELSADMNGAVYSFKTHMEKTHTNEETVASAGVTVQLPDKVMTSEANLVYRNGQSMLASLVVNNVLPTPVIFKVDLKDLTKSSSKMTFSGDVTMTLQPYINSRMLVDMEVNPAWDNMGFTLNYKIGENTKESIMFYHKRTHAERGDGTQWSIDHLLSSTQFASLNYKVLVNHQFSQSALSSSLDIAIGSSMLEETNTYRAHISHDFSDDSNATATVKNGHVKCIMPFLSINQEIKGSYVNSNEGLAINMEETSGDKTQYAKLKWTHNEESAELIHQKVEFEVYGTSIGKWTLTSSLEESPKDVYTVESALSLGTTDELQFVQNAVVVNLPLNKTVQFRMGKGGVGNEIVQISSENIASDGLSYYSKNLIQVQGYESRGLNVYLNAIPRDYSASVEFLMSSVVSVGVLFTAKETDHGRHHSVAIAQHRVQKSTINFKYGYERMADLFESYVTLAADESTIFSSQVSMKTLENGKDSTNVTVMAKEHTTLPITEGLDFYTSISATDGGAYRNTLTIVHRNNNKKFDFHAETSPIGVEGRLDQTYVAELDPLSFSVQMTVAGGFVSITDNSEHESRFEVSSEDNVVTATWANTMPMLEEYAPRNARMIFRSLSDGFRLNTNSEKDNFEIIYRNRWPKLHQFEMTNSLINGLPNTVSWKVGYRKSVATFEAKFNEITWDFKLDHADKFVLTFNHNCDVMEAFYIPNTLLISHVKEDEDTQTQAVSVSLADKSIQFESSVTSDGRSIKFRSSGIEQLPKSVTANLDGTIGENEFSVICLMAVDETPVKLSLSGHHRFSTATTNFPLVTKTGEGQLHVELLKNSEQVFDAVSTLTVASESLKHEFNFTQQVTDFLPNSIRQEKELISRSEEYGLVLKSAYDSTSTAMDLRYSPERVQMSQNMIESIPKAVILTYELGIEQGNFQVVSDGEKIASLEYSMSESSFKVTATHHIELVSTVFPIVMEIDTSFSAENINADYVWGTRVGAFKFTNRFPSHALIHITDNSQPFKVEASYNLEEANFEFSAEVISEQTNFNLTIGNNKDLADGLFKGSASTNGRLFNIDFNVDTVIDIVSFNEIFISIVKQCSSSGSFVFERRLTWNAEDNAFSVTVEGSPRSPFSLEIGVSHNAVASATIEMNHKQDWESVPKHLIITATRASAEGKHTFDIALTTDDLTRTVQGLLMYHMNETGLRIESSVSSELEMIDFQNAGFILDGTLVDAKLEGSLVLQFNGKQSEDSLNIVWNSPRHLIYSFSQNIVDLLPSNGGLKVEEIEGGYKLELSRGSDTFVSELLITENGLTLSYSQTMTDLLPIKGAMKAGITTDGYKLELSKNRDTLVANVVISDDGISLDSEYSSAETHTIIGGSLSRSPLSLKMKQNLKSFLPQNLAVTADSSSLENGDMAISIELDDQASEVRVRKVENGDMMEYRFEQSLPLLPIPGVVSITYRKTPFEISVNWGEMQGAIQLHDNGFIIKQHFVEALPKSVSVTIENDFEAIPTLSNQIDVKIDEYTFTHQLAFNKDELSFSVTESLKCGETSMIDGSINSQLGIQSGHQEISFTQSLFENVVSSFENEIEYQIGKTSGNIHFKYAIDTPVVVDMSYNIEQPDRIHVDLTHNIAEISEQIPMNTGVDAVMQVNGPSTTYLATFTSGDVRKDISLTINYDLEQWTFDAAFAHDFEQLESYLPPMNASVDILSNGRDIDISVFYKMNSEDRYVKLHSMIGENDYLVTVDQKLFEETVSTWRMRKRHQSQIPDKYFFRVKLQENEYVSQIAFKIGPKRRYWNVTVTNPQSRSRTIWKLRIDQNLNKYLPVKLPNSYVLKYAADDTDYTFTFDVDSMEGSMKVTANDPLYALTFTQTSKKLSKAGIPSIVNVEVNNLRYTNKSFHLENVLQYNEYKVSPTIEVNLDEPSLSIAGAQEGFDEFVGSEDFFLKVNGALEDNTFEFSSSHNMNAVQTGGYPKKVIFSASWHCGETEGNIANSAITLMLDQYEFSNNFVIQMDSPTSVEITTDGVRPGQTEKIQYSGKLAASLSLESQTSISCEFFFQEADANSNVIHRQEFEVTASKDTSRVAASVTFDIPSLLPRAIVSGALSWGDIIGVNATWGLGDQEGSVGVTLSINDRVNLHITKDASEINLQVDKNAKQQVVFGHNIESLSYVPKELVVGVDPASYSLTVHTEVQDIRVSFDLQQSSFRASYIVGDEEIAGLSGEYTTHPAHGVSGTIVLTPLNIDISSQFKIQFFKPGKGKSEISYSFIDNTSKKGFNSNVYAFLNDKGIWDVTGGLLVQSNLTDAEFEFETTMVLHATPFRCSFDVHFGDYSLTFNCTKTSLRISGSLPESFPVNSFDLESISEKSEDQTEGHFTVSWNGEQKIATTTVITSDAEHGFTYSYKVAQSFFAPNSLSVNFNIHEDGDWKVIKTGFTEDEGRFMQFVEKYRYESGSFEDILDVSQSYCDYGNFTATTSFSWDETSISSNLKITQEGEDIATYNERFSYANNKFDVLVSWKQPFTDKIPSQSESILTVQYNAGTLQISSDVTHNFESEYVPQHFVVTGTEVFTPLHYDSDWKVESDGSVLATFKSGYTISAEGGKAHLNWKQPYADLFIPKVDYSGAITLIENGVKGQSQLEYVANGETVTVSQEGNLIYGISMHKVYYKVTRNDAEIFFMDQSFRLTPYDFRLQSGWRQTICERMLANFNGSMHAHVADGSVTFTFEVSHSAELQWLPPTVSGTSHITYGESSFSSDWKVVDGSGKVLQTCALSLETTKVGHKLTLTKNVNTEAIRFDINGVFLLESSTLDVDVTIDHSIDSEFVPKNFVTKGRMTTGELSYDSDWTITSRGKELVTLKKNFKFDEEGLFVLLDWKQPYEEFVVESLLISSEFRMTDNRVVFVNILKYNADNSWILHYDRASDDHLRQYVFSYSHNDQEYKYTSEFNTVGDGMTFTNAIQVPEEFSAIYKIPVRNSLMLSMNKAGAVTNVTAIVDSSMLDNPAKMQVLVTLLEETILFKGDIAIKISSPELDSIDAELSLTIDRTNGITLMSQVPPLGFDHQGTVRYDQASKQITIEYIHNHGRPIVFTINLGKIIPTVKKAYKILKRMEVLPKMAPIAEYTNDESGIELVLGVRVRDTPYTLHMSIKSEPLTFSIVTKRRNTVTNEVVTVTAELVDMENVQVEIEINKGLGKHITDSLGSSVSEIKDKVTVIADSVIEILQSFDNFVEGSDAVQAIIDVRRNEMIEQITGLKATILEFLTNMQTNSVEVFKTTDDSSHSGLFLLINALHTGVQRLNEIVRQPWIDLKTSMLTDISNQIYSEIEPMLQSTAALLNKFHAGQLFLELVEEGVNKFVFAMDKNMEALLRASHAPLANFISVTDNKIVFTIPLSFKLRDTIAHPSWGDIKLWITQSAFANEVRNNMKVLDEALRIYNRIRAILNMPLDEVFPPFKGHAELSGFRHIRTFDGKRYSYRSACNSKHILVHDTKYNDFVVYVSFEPVPVITVTTMDPQEGQQTINLKADYSVTDERNRNIMVPSEYNNVIVKRTGSLVSVSTNYGLVVSCNFQSELCTFDVSPFYFGQVSGMLGTFDNEPSDDFTGKGNVIVRNSEELAQSWKVPSQLCAGENAPQRCDLASNEQCSFLFDNERSPFAACFALENPKPYQMMCAKDTCSTVSSQNAVCRAYASYARRCSLQGVSIPAPSDCNKCNAVAGDPFNMDMQVPVSGADVIFVVERADCLRFRKKDYKKMVAGVHSSLRESQASGSINYAVVGFGGPDGLAEPHTVTFGNRIFVESNSGRLGNDDERSLVNALKVGAKAKPGADVLEAVSYASQVPMRAGAARAIILITCDECSAESKIPLDTVRQLLVNQGIVLHHLRQKSIQAGRSSKKVYGFNNSNIFSKSTTLPRSQLKESRSDQCLQLTDLTRGSMWNSNIIGRDVWEIVGGEVRRGVDATASQDCTCGVNDFGSTTAYCTDSRSRR